MLTRVSTTVEELTPTFDLSSKGIASRELVFGRIADSDIFLNTESLPLLISRKHAVISLAGDTLSIQDTGSINGTYVNNQRLLPSQPRVLREGNLVSFGGPQKIVRDGLTHSNPFVYKLSAISALSNNNNAAREARRAASATATPSGEQAVDLTRTTSLEPGPSDIVDLTNSPDVQVGCKRRLWLLRLASLYKAYSSNSLLTHTG